MIKHDGQKNSLSVLNMGLSDLYFIVGEVEWASLPGELDSPGKRHLISCQVVKSLVASIGSTKWGKGDGVLCNKYSICIKVINSLLGVQNLPPSTVPGTSSDLSFTFFKAWMSITNHEKEQLLLIWTGRSNCFYPSLSNRKFQKFLLLPLLMSFEDPVE